MKEWKNVQYDDNGKVTKITLNRPDKLNSLNVEMLYELETALEEAAKSPSSILILTGNGKAFCAGGDIKMMLEEDEALYESVITTINNIVSTLYSLKKVTVCTINGAAAGLGLSIALACDKVVAVPTAILAMNFIGIGLIPDGGGHFFLKNRLGEANAKKIIWEGKKLHAKEAKELGLIDSIIESEIEEFIVAEIKRLQFAPLQAMIETKTILQRTEYPILQQMLLLEKEGQRKMRHTKDHQEGIKAFLEKRVPHFKGC